MRRHGQRLECRAPVEKDLNGTLVRVACGKAMKEGTRTLTERYTDVNGTVRNVESVVRGIFCPLGHGAGEA